MTSAFAINTLGGRAFPLVVKFHPEETTGFQLWLCPQRVVDIADILVEQSQSHLLLFGFGGVNLLHGTNEFLSLEKLADTSGVPARAFDPDIICIRSQSLVRFLQNLNHYELRLIDLPSEPDYDAAASLYCHFDDNLRKTPTFDTGISHLPRFYLHSHDDCYLGMSWSQANFANRIVGRCLRQYVENVLDPAVEHAPVPDPPSELVEKLLAASQFSILRQQTTFNGFLRIGFSLELFRFHDPTYSLPPAGFLEFLPANSRWQLQMQDGPSC